MNVSCLASEKKKLLNPSEGLTAGHKAIGSMSSAKNDAVLFGALLRPISAIKENGHVKHHLHALPVCKYYYKDTDAVSE